MRLALPGVDAKPLTTPVAPGRRSWAAPGRSGPARHDHRGRGGRLGGRERPGRVPVLQDVDVLVGARGRQELRHRLDPRHQRPVGYATGLMLLAGSAAGLAALNGVELSGVFSGWTGVPTIVAATAVWLTGAWLAAVVRRERRRTLVLAVAASAAAFSLVLAALRSLIAPPTRPLHAEIPGVWGRAGAGVVCVMLIDVLAIGAAVLIQRTEPGPVFLAKRRWRRARADHQAATRLAEADAEAASVARQAWLGLVRTQAIAAAGDGDMRLVESTLALAAALQTEPHGPG